MLLVLACKRYALFIGTILFQQVIKEKKILRLFQSAKRDTQKPKIWQQIFGRLLRGALAALM